MVLFGSSYKCYLKGVTEIFLPLPLTKKEWDVQAILSLPATKILIKDFLKSIIFDSSSDALIMQDSKG